MFDRVKAVNTIIRNRRLFDFHISPASIDNMIATNNLIGLHTILDSNEKYGCRLQINDGLIIGLIEE